MYMHELNTVVCRWLIFRWLLYTLLFLESRLSHPHDGRHTLLLQAVEYNYRPIGLGLYVTPLNGVQQRRYSHNDRLEVLC